MNQAFGLKRRCSDKDDAANYQCIRDTNVVGTPTVSLIPAQGNALGSSAKKQFRALKARVILVPLR